ncbi:MAG: YebC/PmpR family DNA-binding transcriptional regulator [Candidatus Eisenbacteria bacterium]
MSGHSKWATIKRKKAKTDAERGKAFTKVIKEITIAARDGGGDPEGNPRLRTAVLAAKAVNMPAANIDRAIKKGTGELPGVSYEEVTYEGYGAHGVAMMVECLTDNRNRTTAEIRHLFSKYGGNLAADGAVGWVFARKGQILVPKTGLSEEQIMEAALEAGAEDVRIDDPDQYEILTEAAELHTVLKELEAKDVKPETAELVRIPSNTVDLGEKEAEGVLKLVDALEDNDDVTKVWANFEIPQEMLERMGG